ncbi:MULTISPECIES: DUF3961 domain-containing protein [Bacillus]|uniref:DUF3961 domain-containing protein n=3 Tax=Bacillus cereus group TaxID=86661 RepID=A0A9W3X1F4_BACTU|nr:MULTISPECIES: DUF3961 domain-containing protein [Bacillus]ANS49260.1 hypothetical protein BT246_39140 [Bacillus thuringiensis]EOO67425.1 hypothetical protein IKE_02552 [Bacillus cereus VD196]KAB7657680.1 DUF3961 domain-containing protein [Bacillus sp. B2-WWTP-C-10-Post-4]MCQ6288226.1 DUF3961 domain-containing protein [Bacillus cereus]MCQ6317307.1 DUF3961 domain-containing protein [Bacillus cereus]
MFAKLNDYFGLETLSDRVWYYGVFGVGGTLYAIDMFIAYAL